MKVINRVLGLLLVFAAVSLSGCASASLGTVTRYEANGQETICWEPSRKMNGLVGFVANRLETK